MVVVVAIQRLKVDFDSTDRVCHIDLSPEKIFKFLMKKDNLFIIEKGNGMGRNSIVHKRTMPYSTSFQTLFCVTLSTK